MKILAFEVQKNTKKVKKENEIILYKKVKKILNEGIIISSQNDIMLFSQTTILNDEIISHVDNVIGFEIFDIIQKELIGITKDTHIDTNNGNIIALMISQGTIDDLLKGYSMMPLREGINLIDKNIYISKQQKSSIISTESGLKKILRID